MMATIAILFITLGVVSAFGSQHVPVVVHKIVKSNEGMTMRVGTKDVIRRQRFNEILHTVHPNPTKKSVERLLLSEETSRLIEKV